MSGAAVTGVVREYEDAGGDDNASGSASKKKPEADASSKTVTHPSLSRWSNPASPLLERFCDGLIDVIRTIGRRLAAAELRMAVRVGEIDPLLGSNPEREGESVAVPPTTLFAGDEIAEPLLLPSLLPTDVAIAYGC